jgi:2-desacetyl-2-hydroxyethyl bacteriochlorophyllide A dehydrogenase
VKALWLEDRTLSVRDVPAPVPIGEALIRVRMSGICGTDLELERGYYPYTGVVGHEFVGEVVKAADADWVGARVVGEINANCGHCESCAAGRPSHCDNRSVLGIVARNGAHAEYLTLPLANLHRVPDSVPDEAAVFTEPLAAAVEILQQVHIRPTDHLLLVGAGRLGQLVAQVLALTGAHVRVVARRPHQRALLAARGIETLAESGVRDRYFDVVVEATGSPSGFELARRAVRPRGTFVLKSTYQGEITLDLSPFVVDEITVVGSRCGPFGPALRMLERGDVDPVPLITKRFPLAEAVSAMEAAKRPDVLKVILEP